VENSNVVRQTSARCRSAARSGLCRRKSASGPRGRWARDARCWCDTDLRLREPTRDEHGAVGLQSHTIHDCVPARDSWVERRVQRAIGIQSGEPARGWPETEPKPPAITILPSVCRANE